MNEKSERTITLKFSDFCAIFLRSDENRPITPDLADVVEQKAKDLLTVFVQRQDQYGTELTIPILWRYNAWADSVDRWQKAKLKSEKERVERFINIANIQRISKACKIKLLMDDAYGNKTAAALLNLKRFPAIEWLGVTLITKESEL